MKWIRKSIRSKIVMTVFACIVVFAMIASPAILLTIQSIHERSLAAQAQSVQRGGENLLQAQEDNALHQVSLLAGTQGTAMGKEEFLQQEAANRGLDFLLLAGPDGVVTAYSGGGSVKWNSLLNMGIVQAATKGSPAAGVEALADTLLAVCAAAPVPGGGVLIGGTNLANPALAQEMQRVFHVDSALYSAAGVISAAPLQAEILPGPQLAATVQQSLAQGQAYIGKQRFSGSTVHSVYIPLTDSSGKVQGAFYNGIDRTKDDRSVMIFTISLLTGICVLCVIALWMIDRVVKTVAVRVNSMVDSAAKISAGDMSGEISIKGEDEVARLGDAFAHMAGGIRSQVQVVEQMAEGNFLVDIPVRGDKDVMGKSLQVMAANLGHILESIGEATNHVTDGSRQISDGAQNLAGASSEQAYAVEELSSSIQNISVLIANNERKMSEAAELVSDIQTMAREGSVKMNQMTGAVEDIDKASSQIGNIMKVIEDIAFQTNILALNAAVESARAGQHGRGFAVVADEVRNLAAKSAQAAKETSGLIEDTMRKAHMGTSIAKDTASYFGRIVDSVERSNEVISEASGHAKEQASLIEGISSGVHNVASVVQQNAAIAQQSAASSQDMSAQAVNLQQLVCRFNTNPG